MKTGRSQVPPLPPTWHNPYIKRSEWIAWCAGVFESEGHVRADVVFKHSKNWRLLACVTQKDVRLLRRFKKIIGGGRIYYNRGPSKCCVWQITAGGDVLRLYEYLAPYLGPIKRQQFKRAFSMWWRHREQHGRVR